MINFSVSTLADLKAAIATASTNGEADTITLTADIEATSDGDFVTGTGGRDLILISVTDGQQLTIAGGGHTLDANYLGRVLEISGGTVAVNYLTIREGAVTGDGGGYNQAGAAALGAGVYNAGNLTLAHVTVTANAASGGGGGGGGYYIGGGGGGGGPGGIAGAGGAGHDFGAPNAARPGSAASGGTGGYGGSPFGSPGPGGYGGSSVGGGGGEYGNTFGGTGGAASIGSFSVGGGGGGSGGSRDGVATPGAGGAAVGGIYNAGSLYIAGGSVSGNVAAGGGGGANDEDYSVGEGGVAIGGLQSVGTLVVAFANVSGNVASGGHAGAAGLSGGGPAATADNNSAAALNHAHSGGLSISGLAIQGQTLTAGTTLGDADGLGTIGYQWTSDGVDIDGATASTFTLTSAQVGHVVRLVGSYTDGLGFADSATSAGTAAIAAPAPPNTSVATLAELKLALTLAASDGLANVITFTGDISATGAGDFVTGTGGRDLIRIAITDGQTLSIVGGGHALDANSWGRALEVSSGTVAISDLTIREGAVAGNGGAYNEVGGSAFGAGVYNAGSLTLTGVTVTANTASGGGGGGGGSYIGGGGGGGGPGLMAGGGGEGLSPGSSRGGGAVGGTGGAGGVGDGYDGSGLGGSSTGGAGGLYGNSGGGSGGTAALSGLSVGGGGGGSGGGGSASNAVGAGGAAVGGIYNTGSLTLSGGSVSGNLAAGGGGGGNDYSRTGGVGGAATGGLLSTGTLAVSGATLTGNIASGGLGASIPGEPAIANGVATNNMQNYAATGAVTIGGTATQGQTLTAANTLADANGLGAISYQWEADGVAIGGATGSTFTLTAAEVGKAVTVVASYTDGVENPESATSTATTSVVAAPDETPTPVPTPTPTPAPTTTVDGTTVTTTTTTNPGGGQTQTLVVAPVLAGRPETSGSGDTADIPVITSGGVQLVTVGLPTGTGFSAAGPSAPQTEAAAAPVLANAIGAASSGVDQTQMAAGAAAFFARQPDAATVVQTVTLSGANVTTPITFTGETASGVTTALVIDTHLLPGQTQVILDNIDFAAIIGEAHITGGAGSQTVYADGAAQFIVLGADDDKLHGGAGNDTVGSAGGDDGVYGDEGDDRVFGGVGADTVQGNAGDDHVQGNAGNDLVYGGQGNDLVYGGQGDDHAFGDLGNDRVFGDLGNDTVSGGEGDDTVQGNAGNDLVQGDLGNDLAYGGQGDDTVSGGEGADRLFGDLGNDTLTGGGGNDTLIGGLGADTFVFGARDGVDRITDFSQADGDHIQAAGPYELFQIGADTVVDFGAGHAVYLTGVQLSSLTSGWISA